MSPTAKRYVEGLPRGIDSYPDARVKGAVVVAAIKDLDVGSLLAQPDTLPPPVERLLRDPPAVSTWIPEAYFVVLMSSAYDAQFADHGGLGALERWSYEGNLRLLSGPIYRILFAVISPERVFVGLPNRWAAFHKGTSLELVESRKRGGVFRMTYPKGLFTDVMGRGFAGAFRAAGEAAGARLSQVRVEVESDTSARFESQWA